jgi:hypothetical protein
MTTLFVIVVVVGILWLILESGAKYGSPAPSMYRTSGNGWILISSAWLGHFA